MKKKIFILGASLALVVILSALGMSREGDAANNTHQEKKNSELQKRHTSELKRADWMRQVAVDGQTMNKIQQKHDELSRPSDEFKSKASGLTREQRLSYIESIRNEIKSWEKKNAVPEGTLQFMSPEVIRGESL